MIIYDDHIIWWSYMMIIDDDHMWWSFPKLAQLMGFLRFCWRALVPGSFVCASCAPCRCCCKNAHVIDGTFKSSSQIWQIKRNFCILFHRGTCPAHKPVICFVGAGSWCMCFHWFSCVFIFPAVFLAILPGTLPILCCIFWGLLWCGACLGLCFCSGSVGSHVGSIWRHQWEDGGWRSDLWIISTTGRNTYTNLISRHTSELFLSIQMDSACEVLEGVWVKRCALGSTDYTKWVWQEPGNGTITFYYPHPSGGWISLIQHERGGKVSLKLRDGAMKVLASLEVPPRKWMHASMNEWAPAYFSTVELFEATAAI